MNKFTMFAFVTSFVLLTSMVIAQVPLPRQSTTGPVPPISVGPKAPLVMAPGGVSQTIAGVPGYCWRHGCGPTAVGMVLGYYATHGCPDLFTGDASTQTSDVNAGIASQGSGVRGSGQQLHYEDYSLPDDTGQSAVIPDSSEHYPTGCHTDNCVADFMHTSWSADGNFYGWSWSDKIATAFTSYVALRNSSYVPQCTQYYMGSTLTWSVLTNEIGHNRPMVFLVDSNGDGSTDHFVTIVAYSDSPTQQYGCLDTWGTCTEIRWCQFRSMSSSYAWGVWGGWAFKISNPVGWMPFHVVSIAQEGNNVRVVWTTPGGRTNALQASSSPGTGYADLSSNIVLSSGGAWTTNYLDVGGATNGLSRFYRVRLVP